ncbi:MAG: NUDIX hydrolase [Planctomycetota bacterium]|jgi:8-oxo-dGTP pyrophosphatase MutT (NUDIX family)
MPTTCTASNVLRQSGVIPYRFRPGGGLEVLLVTTRDGGRWLVPKGHLEPDMTARQSAAKEAEEEAGAIGTVARQPIGSFTYWKQGRRREVELYPMSVLTLRRAWLEMACRRRRWVLIGEAIARVEHDGLRECLLALAGQLAAHSRLAA